MSNRDRATHLLSHYLRLSLTGSNQNWDSDNISEMGELVDCIIGAAVEKVKEGDKKPATEIPFVVRVDTNSSFYRADLMWDDNDPLSVCFEVIQTVDIFTLKWKNPEIRIGWRIIPFDDTQKFYAGFQQAMQIAQERDQYTDKLTIGDK